MELLLGVAAVNTLPGFGILLTVVGVAVSFHVFAYVQNDVLDLPVDRTQPLRAKDPLVTGLISARAAMILAVVQIPLAMFLTWLTDADVWAYVTLSICFLLMTVYNLYGKRSPIPMLTDAVQGASWGCLAIYGSLVAAGHITVLTSVAFFFGFGFIFLINGVHGGLRDLRNDQATGCRTTAIFFGAYPGDNVVISTVSLRVFAFFALAMHSGPATMALYSGAFEYDNLTQVMVSILWILNSMVSVWVLLLVTTPNIENRNQIISRHGIPLLLAPVIIFLPRLSISLVVTMLICYYLPILILDPPRLDGIRRIVGSAQR